MKKIKVRFTVMFEATIEVAADATPHEIGDEVADIDIPENELCKYVEDTFDVETDENGDPDFEVVADGVS